MIKYPSPNATCVEAYLDDVPITDLDNLNWGLTSGVFARTAVIPFIPELADRLLERAKKVAKGKNPFSTLRMKYSDGAELVYKKIYITGPAPHSTPYFKNIKIADRRWVWDRKHIFTAYNVRTKANDKFVDETTEINFDNIQDVPQDIQDRISYKSYSLRPRPVQDQDILQKSFALSDIFIDLIEEMNAVLEKNNEPKLDYIFPRKIFEPLDKIIREQIRPDSSFQAEMARILGLVPSLDIYIDYDGNITFYDKTDGGEDIVIKSLGTEHEGGGHIEFIDNALMIPSKVHILYTPENELRFDFKQDTLNSGALSSALKFFNVAKEGKPEGRYLENVIPCPVPFMNCTSKIGNFEFDRKVYQGEYIEWDEFLNGVNRFPTKIPVTHENIQKHWFDGGMFRAWAQQGEILDPDRDWNNIVGAMISTYRQTFRVNKKWRDKVIGWKAKRVAIVDQATGYQSNSPVFTNFSVEYTVRGLLASTIKKFIKNVEGWDASINFAGRCPFARVSISDIENGIIDINYSDTSQTRQINRVFPSAVDNAPVIDLTDPLSPKFLNEKNHISGLKVALRPDHNLSVILTGSPAGPNTAVGLFDDVVEIKDLVNKNLQKKLVGAVGPELYIRVPAALATLRTAWSDKEEAVEAIEAIYGIFKTEDPEEQKKLTSLENLEKLGLIMNRKEIRNLSLSMAEAALYPYINRHQGSKTGFFQKLFPSGVVGQIDHGISTDGYPTTRISIPSEIRSPNYLNLLPRGTRDFLLNHVEGQ